jgi:hypothetical protein
MSTSDGRKRRNTATSPRKKADAGNAATKDINEFFASAKQLLQKGNEKAAN